MFTIESFIEGHGGTMRPHRRRLALLLPSLLVVAACARGAPLGLSGGDRWTSPLCETPPGRRLAAEVFLGDKGPYLFFLSPDSDASSISSKLVEELVLYVRPFEVRAVDT